MEINDIRKQYHDNKDSNYTWSWVGPMVKTLLDHIDEMEVVHFSQCHHCKDRDVTNMSTRMINGDLLCNNCWEDYDYQRSL